MIDNEIVKDLEDYIKENEFEYFHSNTMGEYPLIKKALNLINCLNAEIKDLQKVVVDDFASEYDNKIKAEAYKEFAELSIKRICEQVSAPTPSESYIVEKCNQTIDNLLKEMESEGNA